MTYMVRLNDQIESLLSSSFMYFFSVFSATSGVNDKISVNAEETKAMKKNIR